MVGKADVANLTLRFGVQQGIVNAVLAAGLRLGVTLSPAKSAVADVRRILGEHPAAIDRLQLNTDSGTEFHEDLWRAVETCAFGEGTNRLVCDNAATFYGIIPGARDAPVTPPRGP